MQQTWLQKEGHEELVLFMLGWAATPNAVAHIAIPGRDVLACYDYRSLAPLAAADFAAYRRIYLFAWSYGVWVSEQFCRELPLYRAVALNGTPYPVHAEYGMRLRAVQRSMRAMARAGIEKNPFNNGGQEGRYMPDGPYAERSTAEKIAELDHLAALSSAEAGEHLRWDAAYIADKDEIFPPANMRAYWNRLGLGTEFEGYHYPFAAPALVLRELGE